MRRAHRPIALLLLLMAVLCSPAGVCLIEGMAAAEAATPAHGHACCKSVDGTFLAAGDDSCCSEQPTGFVHVFRFTLHRQAPSPMLDLVESWMPKTFVTERVAFDRRAPLVLRI